MSIKRSQIKVLTQRKWQLFTVFVMVGEMSMWECEGGENEEREMGMVGQLFPRGGQNGNEFKKISSIFCLPLKCFLRNPYL